MERKSVGENIKNIRKSKGLTQSYVSKKIGYSSPSSLSEIESGKKGIDAHKLPVLAKVLNTKIEYFFT